MSLPNKKRKRTGLTLGIAVAALIFAGVAGSPSQLLKPRTTTPPPTEHSATYDPLGRETPRGSVINFLKYAARQDYATASLFLQQPSGQHINLAQFTREMHVLRPKLKINISLLSDDPNGTVEAGYLPGEQRVGVFHVGDKNTDVILVRVNDPTFGKIWLVSQQTVAILPELTVEIESESQTANDRIRRAILSGPQILGMSSAQWLVWLISIPVSWLLAWLLAVVLSLPRREWRKFRKSSSRTIWETRVVVPLKCMIAILLHCFFVYELHPPLFYRLYYFRLMEALLVGCLAWLVGEIANLGFDRAVKRIRMQHRGGESILVLVRRLSHIVIFLVAVIGAFALLGVNVTAALAGLGIGGLAVALGAQKTLENIIGGVSLLMDKAVQAGDVCKIGDQIGTVEDIGLRSLKLRTLDQNLLVVPNGLLAQIQFENLKSRPKLLIHQKFMLRIETQVDQLRLVLDTVERMLREHSAIEPETARLRVVDFAGASFELELFAYGKTGDQRELTAIRQDVLLKIAEIVKEAGTGFAAQTRLTYQSADTGIDHFPVQNDMRDELPARSATEP